MIYGTFYNAVSILDYAASNGSTTDELERI
jgi:hypothetical protein